MVALPWPFRMDSKRFLFVAILTLGRSQELHEPDLVSMVEEGAVPRVSELLCWMALGKGRH